MGAILHYFIVSCYCRYWPGRVGVGILGKGSARAKAWRPEHRGAHVHGQLQVLWCGWDGMEMTGHEGTAACAFY